MRKKLTLAMNCRKAPLRKSEATRAALISTFTRLVFSKGYDKVSVQGVVAGAGVSRSTFYEYFSNKEEVLRASMSRIFAVIASCVREPEQPEALHKVLGHLWENRRLSDAIFTGAPREILARALSEMIEAHMRAMTDGRPFTLADSLAAIQLAEGQIALLEQWTRERVHCRVDDLAGALHKSSRNTARSVGV